MFCWWQQKNIHSKAKFLNASGPIGSTINFKNSYFAERHVRATSNNINIARSFCKIN